VEASSGKRTAGIERGGRLSDARLFRARLAADIFRLPGGVRNRSAVQSMTAMGPALKRFDDGPAGLFRVPRDQAFGCASGTGRGLAGEKKGPEIHPGPAHQVLALVSCRYPATIPVKLPDATSRPPEGSFDGR
jgi:hypothetical protein